MKYKYFLFDWDGSLGASLPLWFDAYKRLFLEYGIEISYHEIGKKVLGNWEAPLQYGIENTESFFNRLEEMTLPKLPDVKLNIGAKEIIEKIKRSGGKTAVLTTSKRVYVEEALKNNNIYDKLDVFLGREDVQKYKPDPEIIFLAEEKLKGILSESVMIGDTEKDILAAKNAGIDSVLFFPKEYDVFYDRQNQLTLGATYVVEKFEELEKFF